MKQVYYGQCHSRECTNRFKTTVIGRKYCSKRCKDAESRKRKPLHQTFIRVCPECGKEFYATSGRSSKIYCSRAHGNRAHSRNSYYKQILAGDTTKIDRAREYARTWRKRMVSEGRCSRCGAVNGNGKHVCNECYTYLKSRDISIVHGYRY